MEKLNVGSIKKNSNVTEELWFLMLTVFILFYGW